MKRKLSFKNLVQGIIFACVGLKVFFEEERNSRIYIFFAVLILVFGFVFSISAVEWILLLLSISIVASLELLNSAIERLSDRISPDQDILIKKAKDLAAGGVVLAAIIALINGTIIFLPKLIHFLEGIL